MSFKVHAPEPAESLPELFDPGYKDGARMVLKSWGIVTPSRADWIKAYAAMHRKLRAARAEFRKRQAST
jgi:hypothetical protein